MATAFWGLVEAVATPRAQQQWLPWRSGQRNLNSRQDAWEAQAVVPVQCSHTRIAAFFKRVSNTLDAHQAQHFATSGSPSPGFMTGQSCSGLSADSAGRPDPPNCCLQGSGYTTDEDLRAVSTRSGVSSQADPGELWPCSLQQSGCSWQHIASASCLGFCLR